MHRLNNYDFRTTWQWCRQSLTNFLYHSCRLVCQRVWMSNAENCQGKKTRQRRGNGCRDGRDAVGVAAKGRRSIWRQGRVWQGKEGNFRKTEWNGNQVRVILSRFSDLEPPPLPERNSFRSRLFTHKHTHTHTHLSKIFNRCASRTSEGFKNVREKKPHFSTRRFFFN